MRVRKKCTKCGNLVKMSDFIDDKTTVDKKTEECRSCIENKDFEEFNSKIKIKTINNKMATLAEKRAAAKAAAEAGTQTKPETKKVETPKTEKPKVETPKVEKPKKGDKTEAGDTVVGEKSKRGKGRAPYVEKPIEQVSLDGTTVIAVHATLEEAAAAVSTTKAYILDALKGWVKSAAKFKWRYEGEDFFLREIKPRTKVEKDFVEGDKKKKKKDVIAEDVPVPGDLDYDEELHGVKPAIEEEEELDPVEEEFYNKEESEEENAE